MMLFMQLSVEIYENIFSYNKWLVFWLTTVRFTKTTMILLLFNAARGATLMQFKIHFLQIKNAVLVAFM